MLRRLRKNQSGTAEIVGTVLFLVILFFFFSNVFLWHNQATQEMNQVVADKTNSAVKIETTALPGIPVIWSPGLQSLLQGGHIDHTFETGVTTSEKTLIANLRLSIHAYFNGAVGDTCFVQILDNNQEQVNTGLTVVNNLAWSTMTLSLPSSYIDAEGGVTIRIVDASSQSGNLNIMYMAVCADLFALKVTNLGGSEAALSRLWIINATQTADSQTDHVYVDLNGTSPSDSVVAGGSTLTIMLNPQTANDGSISANDTAGNWTLNYIPPAGLVIFRVLTTLGNTAACNYDFS